MAQKTSKEDLVMICYNGFIATAQQSLFNKLITNYFNIHDRGRIASAEQGSSAFKKEPFALLRMGKTMSSLCCQQREP